MISTTGITCKICMDLLTQSKTQCRCGNVGIIYDDDEHLHVYVESISTVQRCNMYHDGNFKEIARELLQPFGHAIFANYQPIISTSHTFINIAPPYRRKGSKKRVYLRYQSYDRELMHFFDIHKNYTSDGDEEFLPTATNNPQ